MLDRTNTVIEDCEQFLNDFSAAGSPVESYLVQHALVVLCSDVQQEIYAMVLRRAAILEDKQIAAFVAVASQRVLRSVGKTELAGFVGFFGQGEKDRFNELLVESDVTIYSNAVNNRHDVAHKQGAQVTFPELKKAVLAATGILEAMSKSIQRPHDADDVVGL